MKKYIICFAALAMAISFSSCSKKKSRLEEIKEFRESLCKEDTTAVLNLADNCMKLLKEKRYDEAISMLNEYDDTLKSVKPLSKETERHLRHTFRVFPVLDYKLSYYSMQLEGLNDIKYNITFAKEEHPEKNGMPVTSLMFNPVKVDGTWYLCVKRSDQDVDELRK